ncbi:MAG: N-acetyltransferase [Bacteroidales bacterium]
MGIEIIEAGSKSQLKQFVKFPYELYKGNKYWVPPLIKEERALLDPGKNPAFEFCDVKTWLARKNNKIAGRIAAIVNNEYIEKTGKKYGRFSRLEFIDDPEVSGALIRTASEWLKSQGMEKIHGPLGFVNLDHQGMLVEGFDWLPSVVSDYHMPYYKEHMEALGYKKQIDWIEFRLTIGQIPEKALKLNELIKKRYKLKVKHLKSTREVRAYSDKVFQLLNESFSELPFMIPYNDKMIRFYTDKFFNVLQPKYLKIITNEDDELMSFIICIPSLSKAMQKAGGKLFPFGFFHVLKALKKNDVADLVLTGVNPRYQKMGLAAILITEQQKTLIENGIKYVETTGMFETNHVAIQHWKNYPHVQHKRKRCYIKDI